MMRILVANVLDIRHLSSFIWGSRQHYSVFFFPTSLHKIVALVRHDTYNYPALLFDTHYSNSSYAEIEDRRELQRWSVRCCRRIHGSSTGCGNAGKDGACFWLSKQLPGQLCLQLLSQQQVSCKAWRLLRLTAVLCLPLHPPPQHPCIRLNACFSLTQDWVTCFTEGYKWRKIMLAIKTRLPHSLTLLPHPL